MTGRILVGSCDGVYVILFEGDVRLTLSAAVDGYLEKKLRDRNFKSVVVDLSRTESIDSTSLGVLAKLSIQADKLFNYTPTLVSTDPDITRILDSMGFEDVFHIVEEPLEHTEQIGELPPVKTNHEDLRQLVLDAHRMLMAMNESNREAFQDLVSTLEVLPMAAR
ncbi:MAG: STAS domain-containing protein [Pseudomonadales bacterium]